MFLHEIVWDSYEMSAVDMKNFLPTALQKKKQMAKSELFCSCTGRFAQKNLSTAANQSC